MKKIQLLLAFFTFITAMVFAQGKTEVLYVNGVPGKCKSNPYGRCFQIKDAKSRVYRDWQNYGGEIKGFDYEVGYMYTISAQKVMHEVPPAKGINYYYRLIKILSKTPMEGNTAIKLSDKKYYFLAYLDGTDLKDISNIKSYIQFDVNANKVSGDDGCNGFSGSIKSINNKVISFGPIMGTLKACPGLDKSDAKINKLLSGITAYKLKGTDLYLLQGSKTVLKCSSVATVSKDDIER